VACDSCNDPLESRCPEKDEFFLYPPRPRWYFLGDGAAIRRNPSHGVDFASLNGPTSIVLSTRNFNYDFAAAGHFLIGHTLNECFQIEGVYTGVAETEDTAAVRDTTRDILGGLGNLFSPFGGFGARPISGLDFNNLAQIHYTSSLQSAELNIRRQVPMPPQRLAASVLFGVRYMSLPEQFDYHTESGVPTPGGAVNSIHIATENWMVGPQIGAMFEFYADNCWWVNFEMKGAVLNNRAQQSTTYLNVDNNGTTSVFSGSQREDHATFAGDLDLTFVYRWSPHFTTRLGYQALFLSGVALAPDNLNTNINILRQGPAQLNHGAGSIYHGPHAGIEIGW
jgi:hypothetical protein